MRSRYVNENYRRDTSDKAIAWAMETLSYEMYGYCDAYILEDTVILSEPPGPEDTEANTYAWKLENLINIWKKYGDLIDDDEGVAIDALCDADLLAPAFSGEKTLDPA